jgi:hypothetical protein
VVSLNSSSLRGNWEAGSIESGENRNRGANSRGALIRDPAANAHLPARSFGRVHFWGTGCPLRMRQNAAGGGA